MGKREDSLSLLKTVGWIATIGLTGALAVELLGASPVTVEKIVDGDTIDVRLDGETTRIRFLNVDTPEIGRDGAPAECLAEEARQYLADRLPIGSVVELEFDQERLDKYGRSLAGVFVDDSLINAEIAREGLGRAVDIAPNHRFYSEVAEAEREANEAKRGLSTLGPECFVAQQDAEAIREAEQAQQEAQNLILLLPYLNDDGNLAQVQRSARRIAEARATLATVRTAGERQSEFQKSAYGDSYKDTVNTLEDRLQRAESRIDEAIAREQERRDAQERAEEQRNGDDIDAARKDTENQPRMESSAPSSSAPPAAALHSGGGGDTYTGCRAYGGNYAFTSVDDEGRRYAKIDCATKAQIG